MDADRARELLTAERQRLRRLRDEQGRLLEQSQTEASGELSSFDQHPGDAASDTVEREQDVSIIERFDAELEEIEAAFTRLEQGRYGICEGTGEPIPDERLEALPAARYTAAYQAQQERLGMAERGDR